MVLIVRFMALLCESSRTT